MSTLGEDYVTVARPRASGRTDQVPMSGATPLPLVTPAISIGFVVGGSILIENIFVYQGIGFRLLEALNRRDYPAEALDHHHLGGGLEPTGGLRLRMARSPSARGRR